MRHTICLKIILNEKKNCSVPRTTIFKVFFAKCCHQSCGYISLSLQLCTGSHSGGRSLHITCGMWIATWECCIDALNPLKCNCANKQSDLETTVSFYLSLGGFIFSVFGFSISPDPLSATCTVPWFFTEILLTWKACGILNV